MWLDVAWNGLRNFQIQYQANYTAFHKGVTVCLVSALALIIKAVKSKFDNSIIEK